MGSGVLVALIAGGVSLLVALISLFATVLSSRSSSKTARSLEELRQSHLLLEKQRSIFDRELVLTLKGLMEAIQAIQRVRDEMLLVLDARKDSLSVDEAMSRLRVARESLFEGYEANCGILNSVELPAYHRATNTALSVENLLLNDLESEEYASRVSAEARQNLKELRGRLHDCQQELRDSRTDRLVNCTIEAKA